MKSFFVFIVCFVCVTKAFSTIKTSNGPSLRPPKSYTQRSNSARYLLNENGDSSNTDMFGGPKASPPPLQRAADQNSKLLDEAARLRQEASEMEVALREEARAKGVPEDMINKLIPIRNPKGKH